MAIRWEQIQNLSVTEAEINLLAGLTATASEINQIAGFTGTSADLNALIGLDVIVTNHLAEDFTTAHPIAANSLDGLILVDGTVTQTKLSFTPALPGDITGLQTQVDDVVADTAAQQTQIDNLFSIVIPGQGSDLADAIQQTIDHIEMVQDAHDSSAISYGNYYTLPSDITGGATTSLIVPSSIIKHFRVGESIRFQDDVTPFEDVVLTAVDYNTYQIDFAAPTASFTTADNGIIWTLAEDNVQEALDRSLRNGYDVLTGRLTINQNSPDAALLLNQSGSGYEIEMTKGTVDSVAGYTFNLNAGQEFVIDDTSDAPLLEVTTDGYVKVSQLWLRQTGTAFHGQLQLAEPLTADRTWSIKDRDALVGMPVIQAGDALKLLRVNATEDDVEYHDLTAADIDYDNTLTGLTATDIQGAIDEHVTDTSIHFTSLDGLDDVDTSTIAPNVDDILLWDGSNFVPSKVPRSSLIRTTFHDPLTTTLPTGSSVTIDNIAGVNGDLVLFSNLTVGANKIYELGGVGSSITWTAVEAFENGELPSISDTVIVEKGDAFALRIGTFNGTTWTFNDTVRYFNGADFWEITNLMSTTILNATTDNVFTTNATGSENVIVDYSISRAGVKEAGQAIITHDGTNANTSVHTSSLGVSGVSLAADILAGQLRLRYTADASGPNGTIKFTIKRWSDSAGGPTGVPVYTGAGSGSAGGNPTEVQYHGAGGVLDGDPNFTWDDVNGVLSLKGLKINGQVGPVTLFDNTTVVTPVITRNATTHKTMYVDYSVERGTDTRTGTLLVTNNGTSAAVTDQFAEIGITGIIFSASISGSNIEVSYTSSSTGADADFKYSIRYWS